MVEVSFAARDVCTATGGTLRWGRPDPAFRSGRALSCGAPHHNLGGRMRRFSSGRRRIKSKGMYGAAVLVALPVDTPRHVSSAPTR